MTSLTPEGEDDAVIDDELASELNDNA